MRCQFINKGSLKNASRERGGQHYEYWSTFIEISRVLELGLLYDVSSSEDYNMQGVTCHYQLRILQSHIPAAMDYDPWIHSASAVKWLPPS